MNITSRTKKQTTNISRALIILFLAGTAFPTHTKGELARLAVGAVGGVCGALGLYAAYNWLFDESDEDFLMRIRSDVIAHKNGYASMTNVLDRRMYESAFSPQDMYRYVERIDESLLYELARIKQNNINISLYRSGLNTVLREMRDAHAQSLKRIAAQEDYIVREQLGQLADQVKTLVDQLDILHHLLMCHTSYFDVYDVEAKMGAKYASESKLLADYYGNQYNQEAAIRHFVVTRSRTSSLPFARVEYRRIIDRDIEMLQRVINRAAYNYQGRLGYARQLLDALKAIKGYVVTDPLYPQELANYEYDQREKERIRIERQKAEFERIRLEEQKRQAREASWQKEREIRLKEEENRLKRRELELKRQKEERERSQSTHVVF